VILLYGNGSKDNPNNLGFGPTVAQALTDFEPGNTLGHTLPVVGQGGSGGTNPPPTSTPSSGSPSPSGSSTAPPSSVPTNLPSIIAQIQQLQSQQADLSKQQQALLDQLLKQLSPSPSRAPSPSASR
jgi:hypothetical protein